MPYGFNNDKSKFSLANLISHLTNISNPHSVTKSQVGLGNVENKSSATIRSEMTKSNVTTALGYTPANSNHVSNTSNPHNVTKAQVGLGNVENVALSTHTSNTSNPHAVTKAQVGLGNVENVALSGHTNNKNNPHNVTKAQVGLGNVENVALSTHTSNTSNPHSVTKAQVGLSNVENKSSATIRGELTESNVTNALGYRPNIVVVGTKTQDYYSMSFSEACDYVIVTVKRARSGQSARYYTVVIPVIYIGNVMIPLAAEGSHDYYIKLELTGASSAWTLTATLDGVSDGYVTIVKALFVAIK